MVSIFIYPLKIIKYKDELCPHCNGRKKSLKRPLSETPYGKYFSINNEERSNFVNSSSNTKYEWECEEGYTWRNNVLFEFYTLIFFLLFVYNDNRVKGEWYEKDN